MDRPSFQFYPEAWLGDIALRGASSAARGLWIDMMALMHQGSPYGYLRLKDSNGGHFVPNITRLAKMTGNTPGEVESWIAELDEIGVLGRDKNGVIFSKKMVRDQKQRKAWAKRQKSHRANKDSKLIPNDVTPNVTPVSPPSSSSSSTPTSNSRSIRSHRYQTSEQDAAARKASNGKGWHIPEREDGDLAWFIWDGSLQWKSELPGKLANKFPIHFARIRRIEGKTPEDELRALSNWHMSAPLSKRKKLSAHKWILRLFAGKERKAIHAEQHRPTRGSPIIDATLQTPADKPAMTPEQEKAYRESGERRRKYEAEQLAKRKAERLAAEAAEKERAARQQRIRDGTATEEAESK